MNLLPDIKEIAGADAYMAQAIRLAGAVPEDAPDPELIATVGILGAGTMGRGIALTFAQSGRRVLLVDADARACGAARAHIEALTDRALARGKLDFAGKTALLARIETGADPSVFAAADLVIEAVPERLSLKHEVLQTLETFAPDTAWITSNTSTLDVDALASSLKNPSRFMGTHFFLPAQVIPLLELVPAATTSDKTVAGLLALARDLGKQAVIAPNGDGFIGNRLFDRFHQEAMYLVEEGALPQEVDAALVAWGFTIGPFRTLDMIGHDILWDVRKGRALRDNPPPQPRIGDALCEAGLLGQKTGRGWFLYDDATPKGRPYEEVQALIQQVSRALGLERRRIDAAEITTRCVTALMVEGLAMHQEGRAKRGSDIDMVYVTGYGFPAALGGPMRLADELGIERVLDLARFCGQMSGRAETAWRLPNALSDLRGIA